MRSSYKSQSFSLVNVDTQASFLTVCLQHGLITTGLRIKLKLMTARQELSPVQQIFKEHIKQSERRAMEIIRDHLLEAAIKLKHQLGLTLEEMNSATDDASPTELISHQRFQLSTERNVKLEGKWRERMANRKLMGLRRKHLRQRGAVAESGRSDHTGLTITPATTYGLADLDSRGRMKILPPPHQHQMSASIPPSPSFPSCTSPAVTLNPCTSSATPNHCVPAAEKTTHNDPGLSCRGPASTTSTSRLMDQTNGLGTSLELTYLNPNPNPKERCAWAFKRTTGASTAVLPKALEERLELMKSRVASLKERDFPPNISAEVRTAIEELANNNSLVIREADKGSCTVIMDLTQYLEEGLQHLADPNTYRLCSHDRTK